MERLRNDPEIRILSCGVVPGADDPEAVAALKPLASAGADGAAPQLVYLLRRVSHDPRTPVLQRVLAALDHRGPVHALRVEDPDALADGVAFVRAVLRRAGRVLVLQDTTGPDCGPAAAERRWYLLHAPGADAPDLVDGGLSPQTAPPQHAPPHS